MSIEVLLRKIYSGLREIKRKLSVARNANEMANAPTYFPEFQRKPLKQREKENADWARKYGEVNSFYTLYGFDIVGLRNQEEYVDYYSFMISRNKVNRLGEWWSYVALLRDKFLFYKFMKINKNPIPEVFAIIFDGMLFDSSMQSVSWENIISEEDYFIKDIDGECASFVKYIHRYGDLELVKEHIRKGRYILQRKIKQHDKMKAINSGAINTLRVITINRDGNPYVLSTLLRVGTSKTGNVDNWAAGGLAIGIEKNGHLKKYGFYKPTHGTKVSTHPDTGVVFSEVEIPMYGEALELACKAHRCFYGIRAIGWDIAISKEGPVFVEGNDNFEISLQQACDRPLRKAWAEACK